jgi:hypothetical protein
VRYPLAFAPDAEAGGFLEDHTSGEPALYSLSVEG